MYSENTETLSISLPASFVHFINDYITTHDNKSPSMVIQDALQLLLNGERQRVEGDAALFDREQQDHELEQAYRDAAQEFDTNWEITASDGLSNETW
jgi:Arc/MetJ-type ribon-helix-helix transcriptional regulator